jgi:RNA polymerase sigma factor (sigma-70 family)
LTRPLDEDTRRRVAELFEQHAADLYARARFYTRGDEHQAMDLVQETFHALVLGWDRVGTRSPDQQLRWLHRVLRNKYVDGVRVGVRRPVAALDRDWESHADTGREALCAAAVDKCRSVIEQMPPERHRVALLRWLAGWTTIEIANLLGISTSTVRVHLMDARKELIKTVGPDLPFPAGTNDEGAS